MPGGQGGRRREEPGAAADRGERTAGTGEAGRPRGDRNHGGRIRTEGPVELWGTDAARFWTRREGRCWFFCAVDHCVTDVVGEPEGNGVVARFIRTLKEECLCLNDFETLEEAWGVVAAFIERYNRGWLLQRRGYLTPGPRPRGTPP